jgi:F-type H+-transporting ATPase subunit delta
MDAIHIAKVYAQALLDIGVEQGKLELYDEELRALHQIIVRDEELYRFFISPKIPTLEKQRVIEKIGDSFSQTVISFVLILIRNERIVYLSDVLSMFSEAYDKHFNRKKAVVTSSVQLETNQLEEIASILNSKFSSKYVIENKIKPGIVGGFIIKFDDVVIDGSILSRLETIKKDLLSKKILDGARFYEN